MSIRYDKYFKMPLERVLQANPQRTRRIIEELLDWYSVRTGLMKGAELPESKPPEGVTRGSYDHIMFLTLSVSIDYQRSAKDLWDSARTTWENENTRWAFFPEEIKKRSLEELIECLARYKLSKKREKDAKIWRTVALSFLELFEGDPRNLFAKFDYDAPTIIQKMKTQYGKNFPYLAGSTSTGKILLLWIRMLHDEARIKFNNLHNVAIPIDIHTARATITTGCLSGKFEGSFTKLTEEAKKAWIEACEGTNHYPLELDEPLWNLSRLGCSSYKLGSPCPKRNQCNLSNFCTVNNPESKMILKQNGFTIIDTKYE